VTHDRALIDDYDLVLLDLDGVVYIGSQAVPGAVEVLEGLAGITPVTYVTNNASRTTTAVAEHLQRLGVSASSEQVLTSAEAAAAWLERELAPGDPVLVVGGEGLQAAVTARGWRSVGDNDEPAAVVMGFGPDVGWRDLARAAQAVSRGARFVATNLDLTVPTEGGPAPGNGALVAAVAAASRPPDVVIGKPQPLLFLEAANAAGAQRPLVVGDRLDTDIEGAVNAGMDSLLVLTGITDVPTLLQAAPQHRPTHVASDLRGLRRPAGGAAVWDQARLGWRSGPAVVRREAGRLRIVDEGALAEPLHDHDGLALVRAACAAAWHPEPGSTVWVPVDDVQQVLGR
jgi:HAD superfamily hydrolase (TIGR01450 family)